MKKKIFLGLFLAIAFSCSVFPQLLIVQAKPAGSGDWRYINLKGEYIFENKFRKCSGFSKEGLAAIFDVDKETFYFIDLKGQILPVEITGFKILSNQYIDLPSAFNNGLAPVCIGKKWGYINTSGKVVIQMKYDKVTDFQGGYALVQSGGMYAVIDTLFVEHPVEETGIIDVKHFSENLAPFKSKSDLMGYIGTNGKIAIQAQFLTVGYFSAGLAWAKTINAKIGFIDSTGTWVIQPQFEAAKNFDPVSGLAWVKLNGKAGFVNRKGEVSYFNIAESTGDFAEGLCWGRKKDIIGFFNNKGEWVIQPRFDTVNDFKNGYAAARQNDKWGIIDKEGNWVIAPTYDGMRNVEAIY